MIIELDAKSPIPLGEQLQAHIRLAIHTGELKANEALPTVKELAASLKLNYNTVAAAYRALESEGYVVQNRRAGTKVAPDVPRSVPTALAVQLGQRLAAELADAPVDIHEVMKYMLAQQSQQAAATQLTVAVLARSPLEAQRAAHRASTVLTQKAGQSLGQHIRFVPQTLAAYESSDYHLTVIDPELLTSLNATVNVISPQKYSMHYSPEFPAGAD